MNEALWLLLKLRFLAWLRRMGRNTSTVKGAIMTAIFAVFAFSWLLMLAAQGLVESKRVTADPVIVTRISVPGLALFCLIIVLTTGTKPPILYTPAEIQFMFCGPFTRRQLLTYKLLTQFVLTLPFSLFMAIVFRGAGASFLTTALAMLLAFSFLQLFGLAVNFTFSNFSALAYNRFRKMLLVIVMFGVVAGGIFLFRQYAAGANMFDTLKRLDQEPAIQALSTPLRWYSQVLTARTISDLWLPLLGTLAINGGLLVLIYVLDAKFLEAVSTASEKTYARLERMRRGGSVFQHSSGSRVVRRQVMSFPFLGGIGPIAWRHFVTAQRSQRAFMFLIIILAFGITGPIIAMVTHKRVDQGVPWGLAGMALFMSLFVNQFLMFDFRGDVDRMEVLKQLPLPAWKIAVGQLLMPALLASLIQVTLVAGLFVAMGTIGPLVAAVAAFALPFNFLLVGIDNFLFLLFPARMVASHPGDFTHAGRQMLLFFGRGIGLLISLALPGIAGGVVFAATRNSFLAAAAAWFAILMVCWLPVPLVAWAFQRFDVARDTPP